MKMPLLRAAALVSLLAGPLAAQDVQTVRTTGVGTGINTGDLRPNQDIGTGSSLKQGDIKLDAGIKTIGNAPAVDLKTQSRPGAAVTPSGIVPSAVKVEERAAPVVQEEGTPVTQGQVQPTVSKGPVPSGLSHPTASSERLGGPAGIYSVDKKLKESQAPDMDPLSVRPVLDKIFDLDVLGSASPQMAKAAASGALMQTEEKIEKTVVLANTSSSRDAPELYHSAIKTAEDALPALVAQSVKAAVLGYALEKAAQALPDLANSAYQSAASGLKKEVDRDLKALDQWEKLLGFPGRPLVSNAQSLKSDIGRILQDGAKGKAPRIWFSRVGSSFNAMLPSSSVKPLPLDLAGTVALHDAVAAFPLYQQTFLAFQARPTLSNGLRLVYRTHRQAGRSAVGSTFAAAAYGSRSLLARIWQAVKAFVLKLLGRAPASVLSRGFSLDVPAALGAARSQEFALPGARLRLSRREAPFPRDWQQRLASLERLQQSYVEALALFSRSAPWDVRAAHQAVRLAASMADSYQDLSGDGSARSVVRGFERRLQDFVGVSLDTRLTPDMAGLIADPEGGLRFWVSRMRAGAQESIMTLGGGAAANVLLADPAFAGKKPWALADLGSQTSSPSAGLRAAARIFIDSPVGVAGSFAVRDSQLFGRWGQGGRYGKVYAYLPPDGKGACVRLSYEDAGGVTAAAGLLSSLGFTVETRGRELSAVLDGDESALSAAELELSLAQAVNQLQPGGSVSARTAAPRFPRQHHAALEQLVSELRFRRAEAKEMSEFLRSSPAFQRLQLTLIGRVGDYLAKQAQLVLADGSSLSFSVLEEAETGLPSFARVELRRPGEPTRRLTAAQARAALRP